MNRDPFLRLALIAACTAYGVGLIGIGLWFGDFAALAALTFGIGVSFAMTYEASPKAPEADRRRRLRQPAEGTRGFERIE